MSGPLGSLEHALESVVERPFARLFRVRVQPEQILRALERAADRAAGGLGRRPVPAGWEVRLDPGSPLLAEEIRGTTEAWLAERLRYAVVARGRVFDAHPFVSLVADPRLGRADLRVAVLDGPDGAGTATAADAMTDGAGAVLPGDARPTGTVAGDASAAGGQRRAGPSSGLLVEVHVPGRGVRRRRVPPGDLTVGRGRRASIGVPHATVSRLHGRLTVRHGVLVYVDLGSRNGSRLNGVPVTEAAVGEGDRIDLGAASIVVAGRG